jgi:type II secretory pathway component PulF
MATFRYIARSVSGAEISGVLQGDTRNEVLLWLRQRSFTPVSLEEVALVTGKKRGARRLRIRSSDMASFCWQLNTMIDGGVTITDAIDTIVEDVDNRKLQTVLQEVSQKMREGISFYDSITAYPKIFNPLFCAMIRAGESSGMLTSILARLADYFDRKDELQRKVKKAIAYPAFVVGFVFLVLIAMMTLIIPRFMSIFEGFGAKLPAFTLAFMGVYKFIVHNAPFIAAGFALFVLLLIAFDRTAFGHRKLSKLWLRLPLLGTIFRFAFVATYSRTLGTLLGAGVPVLSAITIIEGMTKNDVIRDVLSRAKEQVAEGVSIALSMAGNKLFPHLMVKMVQVGEESGSLPAVLDRSSNYYEKKVDTTVMTMIAVLEPAMIVLVGGIVLLVLLALYMPIFSMSGSVTAGQE